MRALILLTLLGVAAVSATPYLELQTFDQAGATASNFLCVGNKTTSQGPTSGQCVNGLSYWCDSNNFYQVAYDAKDSSCYWGNATSVTVISLSLYCGATTGYSTYVCKNTSDAQTLPWGANFPPSGWSSLTRAANYNNTYDSNAPKQVIHGFSQTCADSQWYSQTTSPVKSACSKASGAQTGYSQSASCDSDYTYGITQASTDCTGSVVSVSKSPIKCQANGVRYSCANPTGAPGAPTYAVATGGYFYATQTVYANADCTGDVTSTAWYSNACQGSAKYACSGNSTTQVLTQTVYSAGLGDSVVQCNGTATTSTPSLNTCSGSTKWQCVYSANQPGAASSLSISFVAIFVAALVALVARQ